ncbi:MAG: response regulator transcription factor [bacterium]|nr:response regulator transcription factor [bacterium]
MSRILLVDDDIDVLTINRRYLQRNGYEVITATTAKEGIDLLKHKEVDCIVLDVMLPDLNGFDASVQINSITNAPFIFLTGKNNETDKLHGLELGANDYIVKPYSLKELSARIKVQLRLRHSQETPANILSYPPLSLNTTLQKAYYYEEEISLSKREYELLFLLVSNINQIVTFEHIGDSMWGVYNESDRRTIMVTASRLRKKLEQHLELESRIETIWSKGYKYTYQMR